MPIVLTNTIFLHVSSVTLLTNTSIGTIFVLTHSSFLRVTVVCSLQAFINVFISEYINNTLIVTFKVHIPIQLDSALLYPSMHVHV